MKSIITILLACSSLAFAKPISLFELSFEEVLQEAVNDSPAGAYPADTYPLLIRPPNFAPAVVAPPAFLFPFPTMGGRPFGTKGDIRGAIPLFAPLRAFPYIQYVPISTSFYLSEPNLREPIPSTDNFNLPGKVAAPQPAFSPIRDTQISRRPQKQELVKEIQKESEFDKTTQDAPAFVRVVHFPTEIGSPFQTRGDSHLTLSAPAGIVQSTQPHFSHIPFMNSKASLNLLSTPLDTRTAGDSDNTQQNLPTIIDA